MIPLSLFYGVPSLSILTREFESFILRKKISESRKEKPQAGGDIQARALLIQMSAGHNSTKDRKDGGQIALHSCCAPWPAPLPLRWKDQLHPTESPKSF
jgi:hypothetical protein